ncbi:MAG: S1 RNA-binding domain-containing protein [bacterium]
MEQTETAEELSMAELLKTEDKSLRDDIKQGEIILVKIAAITNESVLVDVGMKSEGSIPKIEFKSDYLATLNVGDSIPVFLTNLHSRDGSPDVSFRKAYEISMWGKIEKDCKDHIIVEGKITKRIKGGFIVDIGIEAFMPSSQLDMRPVRNQDVWVGKKIQCLITEADRRKNNVVVSRRKIEEKNKQIIKDEILARTTIGDVVAGKITGITKFGAFVDIGGIEGLLHVGNISWYRINNINQVLHVGDTVKVKILSIENDGNKISLGKKQLEPHPWEGVEERFEIGSIREGKVASVTNFGVFVELEPGVEGLVHATEMSWKDKNTDPRRLFSAGKPVKVKILSLNRKSEKISLSIKKTEESPWEKAKALYKPKSRVTGTVSHLTPFGAFVMLPLGIEGLIHISDMVWIRKIKHSGEIVKKGQEIEAVVLEVNVKEEKISLGLKQLTEDPYAKYKVGKHVEGRVKKLTGFGAVIELERHIDAFVHVSEMLSPNTDPMSKKNIKITDPAEILKMGEHIHAKILRVNRDERKIDLSIKKYEKEIEKREMQKYMNNKTRLTLGDLLNQNEEE